MWPVSLPADSRWVVVYQVRFGGMEKFSHCPVVENARVSYDAIHQARQLLLSAGWQLGYLISCEEYECTLPSQSERMMESVRGPLA